MVNRAQPLIRVDLSLTVDPVGECHEPLIELIAVQFKVPPGEATREMKVLRHHCLHYNVLGDLYLLITKLSAAHRTVGLGKQPYLIGLPGTLSLLEVILLT